MSMVKIVRIAKRIFIILFLLIAISVTFYLFMFNRFNISCFGNKYYLINSKVKGYKSGSLLAVKQDLKSINVGDKILFYNINTTKREILASTVKSIEQTNKKETTYELENNRFVSSSYVLGRSQNTTVIPVLGGFLNIFSSTIGYLFLILLPVLGLFVYQLRAIIIKRNLWGLYD